FVPGGNPSQGTYDHATGRWTVGTIGVNQSATLPISAMVTQPGTFTNTATKTFQNEVDPNINNDTASATRTTPSADLSITKTDGPDAVCAGNTVTSAITVVNGGPSAVVGAPVTDIFPAELDPASISWTCAAGPGASCGKAAGTGNINTTVSLEVGAAATFTVPARVLPAATGTLANTAMVSPPPGTTDPKPGDNTATDMTAIDASADLIPSKSGPPSITPPGSVVFTVRVTNAGPSTAKDVVITDPTPTGLTFVSNTGACDHAFP